jgi:Outer membrane protein and related peptidoglycan-associated (lipo)proteins
MYHDPLGKKLRTPQALEILASIDPGTADLLQEKIKAQKRVRITRTANELFNTNIKRVDAAPLPSPPDKKTIRFTAGKALPDNEHEIKYLLEDIHNYSTAGILKSLEIRGYAEPSGLNSSEMRRLSLARSLVVRDMLTGYGVAPSLITVRGLGNKTGNEAGDSIAAEAFDSLDRVDVLFIQN